MLPPELLQAVADRQGRIACVVGAGCSLEAPTSLQLASVYSEQAFETLKLNGVLGDGDCNPSDLSEVASAVFSKEQSQAPLVKALPRTDYQHARPNLGHLLGVALMAEGAISCIATLNFDMALSTAITQLHVTEIATVSGPHDLGSFGDKTLVYLHRNAYEADSELWILRREAIDEQWEAGWEGAVAERISLSPQLVFVGLGSKAAALTESLRRVKARVPDQTCTYVVDPATTSEFVGEVELAAPEHHIQLGWIEFMTMLAGRLTAEHDSTIVDACDELAEAFAWGDGVTTVRPVLDALGRLNLVELGLIRGQWLGTGAGGYAIEDAAHRSYVPDSDTNRKYIADLVLGLGALVASEDCTVEVTSAGTVKLEAPSSSEGPLTVRLVSGRGIEPWGVIDQVEKTCSDTGPLNADVILYASVRTKPPIAPVAPSEIVGEIPADDITYAVTSPRTIDVDDLRTDPDLRSELAR
ncbi:MAG: hypothetical protein JJU45_20135 [Acidimicrobiia bacterium]|nr:hypothetical protein [Acidimicrobiia bacterium]